MNPIEPEARDRLAEAFRACLDAVDDGLEASDAVDLQTLLAELAGLKNEVKLESRHVKAVLDETRATGDSMRDALQRAVADLDRAREQQAAALRQLERQMLLEVLDLRDRIAAGLDALKAARPSWRLRWFARRELRFRQSVLEGQALTLQRLDHLLERHRVRPIEALNQPVDPHQMNVVGTRDDGAGTDGSVCEVQRQGFRYDGEVIRYADVIVNKRNRTHD